MESFEITRQLPPVRILGRVEERSPDGELQRSWDVVVPVIDVEPSQPLDASVSTGSLRRSRTASVVQIPGLLHAPGFVPQALRSLGPEGATQATATDRRLVRPEEI